MLFVITGRDAYLHTLFFVCFKYLVVKVSRNLTYLYYHLHGFLHCLHADKLVRSVEVAAAGEDVRTWQTLE